MSHSDTPTLAPSSFHLLDILSLRALTSDMSCDQYLSWSYSVSCEQVSIIQNSRTLTHIEITAE